jgi:hypothetical protein
LKKSLKLRVPYLSLLAFLFIHLRAHYLPMLAVDLAETLLRHAQQKKTQKIAKAYLATSQ